MTDMRDSDGYLWIVARTEERRAAVANFNLLAKGYRVFWVHYHTTMLHGRKSESVLRGYFPGYIFVGVEEEIEIPPISRVRGIGMRDSPEAALLWSQDDKHYLPPSWLDRMRSECLNAEGLHEPPNEHEVRRQRLAIGTMVKVRGPWEKCLSIIMADGGDYVDVDHGEMWGKRIVRRYDPVQIEVA